MTTKEGKMKALLVHTFPENFTLPPPQYLSPDTTFVSKFVYPYPDMVWHLCAHWPAFSCPQVQCLQCALILHRLLHSFQLCTSGVISTPLRFWVFRCCLAQELPLENSLPLPHCMFPFTQVQPLSSVFCLRVHLVVDFNLHSVY